ncbi:MAG: methionyl-tRNA formyltransferase [Hyphomicrobiaceae bacterium]
MTLRLVFMGTPPFSVPTLEAILEAGHEVCAVYSQPPRRAGRGMAETKGPVQAFAEAHGLPVLTPLSLKGADEQAVFTGHQADAAVVVAYGLLLPQAILDAPRRGCYNLHASALPRWRGAAPIHRAIMAGDVATASVVMRMEAGLDTGPMCLVEQMAIGPDMTTGALHDALSGSGAALMVRALAALERGELAETAQPAGGVTYAAKIDKAEARLDFSKRAGEVHNLVRGLSPFPGAWFEAGGEGKRERIKVLASTVAGGRGVPGELLDDELTIACGEGAIRLLEVQRAGKKPQKPDEFLRGFALKTGDRVC